jgi:hypothetical protein
LHPRGSPSTVRTCLNEVFATEPLSFGELAAALGVSSLVFVAVEIEKWVRRHRDRRGPGRYDAEAFPDAAQIAACRKYRGH